MAFSHTDADDTWIYSRLPTWKGGFAENYNVIPTQSAAAATPDTTTANANPILFHPCVIETGNQANTRMGDEILMRNLVINGFLVKNKHGDTTGTPTGIYWRMMIIQYHDGAEVDNTSNQDNMFPINALTEVLKISDNTAVDTGVATNYTDDSGANPIGALKPIYSEYRSTYVTQTDQGFERARDFSVLYDAVGRFEETTGDQQLDFYNVDIHLNINKTIRYGDELKNNCENPIVVYLWATANGNNATDSSNTEPDLHFYWRGRVYYWDT